MISAPISPPNSNTATTPPINFGRSLPPMGGAVIRAGAPLAGFADTQPRLLPESRSCVFIAAKSSSVFAQYGGDTNMTTSRRTAAISNSSPFNTVVEQFPP